MRVCDRTMEWCLVADRARRQSASLLSGPELWGRAASPGVAPWLVLAGLSLVWAVTFGHDKGHSAAVMLAISLAALLSSVAGFAFSAISGAILFHFTDDTVKIVQLMIMCSIANQAAMTWAARRDIDWRGLPVYLSGGVPGLAIGVWILTHVDRMLYVHVFGGFLLIYGGIMLFRPPVVVRRQPVIADFATGFLGGITGGAAGFPGAFVTIWCGMKGWDKVRQRAVVQPFILIMQIAALLAISLMRSPGTSTGATSVGIAFTDLLFIPASLFGTMFGLTFYRRMTDRQFARAVNLLLIVSGLSYMG